jgi:hypothetical protein
MLLAIVGCLLEDGVVPLVFGWAERGATLYGAVMAPTPARRLMNSGRERRQRSIVPGLAVQAIF